MSSAGDLGSYQQPSGWKVVYEIARAASGKVIMSVGHRVYKGEMQHETNL